MKKQFFIVAVFLFIVFTTAQAQHKPNQTTVDSTQVHWQVLLQPAFKPINRPVSQSTINYVPRHSPTVFEHYVNIFNSVMIQFILTETNKYIDLNDLPAFQYVPFNVNNAFQYNFMLERTDLYYISDLQKSNW